MPEPLERADDRLLEPALPSALAGRRVDDLAEAPLDGRRRARRDSASAAAVTSSDANTNASKRKQERHAHTSILMTLRIQTNPIACMTIGADEHHLAHRAP